MKGTYKDGPVEVEGEVSGGDAAASVLPNLNPSLAEFAVALGAAVTTSTGQTFDASTFRLHIDATNTSVSSSSGLVTVTVWYNSNQMGAQSFGYTRVGNDLVFSNPSAVEQWLTPFDGVATRITYKLSVNTSTPEDAQASINVTQYDGSVAKSSTMTSWTTPSYIDNGRPPKHQQ